MIAQADAVKIPLPDQSIHCIMTSPPYYGLRKYSGEQGQEPLGLEATPERHIERIVEVGRELWRILRPDGVCFINYGDCYATTQNGRPAAEIENDDRTFRDKPFSTAQFAKAGSLMMMPHRVALALQADGWIVRQDLVWFKRNPMPESVNGWRWQREREKQEGVSGGSGKYPQDVGKRTGRPSLPHPDNAITAQNADWKYGDDLELKRGSWRHTRAHEFVFQLTKGMGYYGNAEAIREVKSQTFLTEEDARWLALLVDTEGSIGVRRSKGNKSPTHSAYVSVGNASRALLQEAVFMTGLGHVLTREGDRVPLYYWQLTSNQARDVLKWIYPHLIVKQRQARLVIYCQQFNANRGGEPGVWSGGARKVPDDIIAIRESLWKRCKKLNNHGNPDISDVPEPDLTTTGRNPRSVLDVPTAPYRAAHYATFPPNLIAPLIRATCPRWACPVCGQGWAAVVDKSGDMLGRSWHPHSADETDGQSQTYRADDGTYKVNVLGYRPTCEHPHTQEEAVPGIVFDPFVGSGTTIAVAKELLRTGIGVDISMEYLDQQAKVRARLGTPSNALDDLPLFSDNDPAPPLNKQDSLGKSTYTGFNARWKDKHK